MREIQSLGEERGWARGEILRLEGELQSTQRSLRWFRRARAMEAT